MLDSVSKTICLRVRKSSKRCLLCIPVSEHYYIIHIGFSLQHFQQGFFNYLYTALDTLGFMRKVALLGASLLIAACSASKSTNLSSAPMSVFTKMPDPTDACLARIHNATDAHSETTSRY